MEIRKAVNRIVALGTGATMVGATVLGAMAAADLSQYPAPFISDGKFDAVIVLGSHHAATADVIAAMDVQAGLEVGAAPGDGVDTVIEGDAHKISTATDRLNLYEYLSADSGTGDMEQGPISIVTKNELDSLADGQITNAKGTFTYNQLIQMPENASVVYAVDLDKSDDPALYLKFESDSVGYIYKMTFPEALRSEIDTNNKFRDLENRKITMLGKEFTIINSNNNTGEIEMMAGAIQDVLTVGDSKTYTLDGKDYDVEIMIVSDTKGWGETKLLVNGQPTELMAAGDTYRLADGTELGIREVVPARFGSEIRDIVEFYLGAEKMSIRDSDYTTQNWGGRLRIGNTDVTNVGVNIVGSYPASDEVAISSIEFNWTTIDDYYVPVGGSLSEELPADYKDQLLLRNLDFEFTGVDFGQTETINVRHSASERMRVSVPTKTGGNLNIDAFYLVGSNVNPGRTAARQLVLSSATDISRNYQFIVSSNRYSHLLELSSFDSANNRVTLKNVGLGTTQTITTVANVGTFYLDGRQYQFTANYTASTINMNDFGSDAAATIWTPGDASVALSSVNATTGRVQFTEYYRGPADGTQANVRHVNVTVVESGGKITATAIASNDPNFEMLSWDSKTNFETGMTRWGTLVEYDTSGDQSSARIVYPIAEAEADVYITSGTVRTVTRPGVAPGVDAITVGSAKLDTEVADWRAQNVIVVGGPCVNRVAAGLIGIQVGADNCADGFVPGEAKIKLYQNLEGQGDNVALLVAGYAADDTRRAGRVLGNWRDYNLVGTEVKVTGTTLTDVTVSVPTTE